ncbi:hypothetical protein VL20_4331 [Microcystis panniformis FACHB-1757]|uniref:Uncharacterized protein n=1 Tax=Microcystis panniformis FACHB-1757 TaxID=1638788 RepID=A0A0K1S5D5_9CHRO|nr:hypothetical protein VL20_4331 [Microcystis panniformis FACHB-1757]
MSRYYQSAQKAKPNQDCENIPGSCWVSLGQPNLRVLLNEGAFMVFLETI